jgi:hypothetical protein
LADTFNLAMASNAGTPYYQDRDKQKKSNKDERFEVVEMSLKGDKGNFIILPPLSL